MGICDKVKIRKILHLVICYFGPKPPEGDQPSAERIEFMENLYPNLETWSRTGRATGDHSMWESYNCIGWSVSVTGWLWPGNTVAHFDKFYAEYGWSLVANGDREYKKRKIALYAYNSNPNDCKHASLETHNCGWDESKIGWWERIMHIRSELEGGNYGNIIRYYEKHDENANLDLL